MLENLTRVSTRVDKVERDVEARRECRSPSVAETVRTGGIMDDRTTQNQSSKKEEERAGGKKGWLACKKKASARSRSRLGELLVGTFNVRVPAFTAVNGIGDSKVILTSCQELSCGIVCLWETYRDDLKGFEA